MKTDKACYVPGQTVTFVAEGNIPSSAKVRNSLSWYKASLVGFHIDRQLRSNCGSITKKGKHEGQCQHHHTFRQEEE
jgi:hypothetical protein